MHVCNKITTLYFSISFAYNFKGKEMSGNVPFCFEGEVMEGDMKSK